MLPLMDAKSRQGKGLFRKPFFFTLLTGLLMLHCACTKNKGNSAQQPEAPLCETFSDLYANDKKVVSILCRNSDHPEQHPTGEHDIIDESGQLIEMKETYVELVGQRSAAQVVLTSKQHISCPGTIRVIGEADAIDIGGTVGKSTYQRPWVKVHSFECQD
jgi:hypothetical protein